MRSSKPITVTLGKQQQSVERRLRSGAFSSASEVMRAAVRALDREEEALNDYMRAKIRRSLDDPRHDIPAEEVFAKLLAYHEEQMRAEDGDA